MDRITFFDQATALQYATEALARGCGVYMIPDPNGSIEVRTWDRPSVSKP